MPRRGEDNRPDSADAGGAEARLQQFLQARGLTEPDLAQDDDGGESGSDAGPGEEQESQGRQPDEE